MRLPRVANAIRVSIYAVVTLLALASAVCAAQSDLSGSLGGSIAGRVVGPDGRGVRGALVRLEDEGSGEHSDAVSDGAGDFIFDDVAPGGYTLRVGAAGLSDWEADHLAVGLGTAMQLQAQLASLTVHRTILVNGGLGDRQRNGLVAAENEGAQSALADLPNNDRHWSALANLLGGGVAGEDGGQSFRGLSPLLNSIALDGTDHMLAFRARERGTGVAAGSGFSMGSSTVGSFQVAGCGSPAETGHAAAGAMNTVTKSGSNHMHGQGVFYDRGAIGQTFNAFTRTMAPEPAGTTVTSTGQPVLHLNGQPVTYVEVPYHAPDRRQEWEVSAGGPIRRDRVFWFFAWEQHERHDPAVARANDPEVFFAAPSAATLTTLEARIATSASPIAKSCGATSSGAGSTAAAACAYATVLNDLNGMLGAVPRSTRQTNVFPKINWRVNRRNNLVLQYNMMRRTAPHGALGAASETYSVGSFGNSSTSDDLAIARWEYFATPRLLSSARVQWSRNVLAQTPGMSSPFEQPLANNSWGLPPEVSIDRSQGFSFGTLGSVNKRAYPAETRWQLVDAGTWIRRKHALRFGYDYNHVTDTLDGLNGENGAFTTRLSAILSLTCWRRTAATGRPQAQAAIPATRDFGRRWVRPTGASALRITPRMPPTNGSRDMD